MVVTILACIASTSVAITVFMYWHFNVLQKECDLSRDKGYYEGLAKGVEEGVKVGYKKGAEDTATAYKEKVQQAINNIEAAYSPQVKPKQPKNVGKKTPDLHKLEKPSHLKMVTEEKKDE